MRGAVLLLALLASGACEDSRTAEPPGLRPGEPDDDDEGEPAAPSGPPRAEPSGDPRPTSPRPPRPIGQAAESDAEGSAPPGASPQGTEPSQPDQDSERDLPSELHTAIGNPAPCLPDDGRGDLPDRLTIRVQAHVSVTGVITRAEASGASLPEEALRCVERQARAARLQGPVPNAPRAVRTRLTLER